MPIQLADTFWLRLKGLMGKPLLMRGDGLWILPCNSVHTLFMRAPIDVVYLDKDNQVMCIIHALKPWRVSLLLRARSVVELPAGEADRLGWKTGAVPVELQRAGTDFDRFT